MTTPSRTLSFGILIFPGVQLLDFAGPWDAFGAVANSKVYAIGKTLRPVEASGGLPITPNVIFDDVPALSVFCVPGGAGVDVKDVETINFIKRQAARSEWITSVCTGSLMLGAAGLLQGKRATTHWGYLSLLSYFGATPVHARFVQDGRLITGGGASRLARRR